MPKPRPDDEDFDRVNSEFEEWRKSNPNRTFREFYAERKETRLASGRAHASLGAQLVHNVSFADAGLDFFIKLLSFGLKDSDTCVDYGCGTLRVGYHVINYLGRGKYWGLDIAEFLLDEGRALIGEAMVSEKAPNLRVIGPEAVAAAAAAKPEMLYSNRVLPHVHPSDLEEYISNIMTIIGVSGQAIILGKCSPGETIQYRTQGWAHSLATMSTLVTDMGGVFINLKKSKKSAEAPGEAQKGMFRVVHKSMYAAKQ